MINKFIFSLLIACTAITCLLSTITSLVHAATLPAGFSESIVPFSGLTEPTAIRFSPDGRVFVAEKSGLIKVFANLSATTYTVFHDLRTNVHNFWDRGLLGLALHPNFPTVPSVYVLYTYDKDPNNPQFPRWGTPGVTSDGCPNPPGATTNGCVVSGRLSRLENGTETVLVEGWGQQFPSHSVGTVVFGADGALYASAGDGASFTFADYGQTGIPLNPLGDPPVGIGGVQTPPTAEGGRTRAQSLRRVSGPTVLNGTVIRVDPFTGNGLSNNPLFSSADPNARRIVGYGFRNPFRFTVRPGTNELWVGDVGNNVWEEIDRILNPLTPTVSNFGWPCYEGTGPEPGYQALGLNICQTLYSQPGGHTLPYFTYNHSQQVVAGETCPTGSSSISGLAFNQGGTYPASYQGALFFSDFSRDCIWSMFTGANGLPDPATRATFVAGAANPVDLQIGPGGDLFYVDFTGGTIRRIQFTSGNQAPNAVIQATPLSGPAPLTVTFDGRASSDPNAGDTLTYSWDLNGDGFFGDATTAQTSFTYTEAKLYNVQLKVTDNQGASDLASVSIQPGNSPPTASIDAPGTGLHWKVGDLITFSGHATDPNETLPLTAFLWEVILHHCPSNCHTHPVQSFPDVTTASFSAPDHDSGSYLEIKLTVKDAGGLTDTKSLRLDPQTVVLTFQSDPSGLQLAVGDSNSPTPFTRTVILGSANSMSAVTPQTLGATTYNFASWSDNGSQTHLVTATAPASYTATYSADATTPPPTTTPPASGGGGGCTLDRVGTGDALLPILFLVVLGLLLVRTKRRANEADRTLP
jgi:glucose/arabinose dehydrogenase